MRRRPTFTRADRIRSLMQDEVRRIIEFELSSPIARHIQVTDTKLAADMGHLRIRFIMKERPAATLGDTSTAGGDPIPEDANGEAHGSPEKAQTMLDSSAGYVARVLCDVLQLRKAPKIVFSYDLEYAQMKRVREILEEERGVSLLLPADVAAGSAGATESDSTGSDSTGSDSTESDAAEPDAAGSVPSDSTTLSE